MNAAAAPWLWPGDRFADAVASTAARSGLDEPVTEAIETRVADVEARLSDSAPAIVRVGPVAEPGYAAVLRCRGRTLFVLAPDLSVHRVDVGALAERMCLPVTAARADDVERVLAATGIAAARLDAARRALLRQQLGGERVSGITRLRLPAHASLAREQRAAGLWRRLCVFLAAHCVQYGLWILSWWLIGRAALEGRFDRGWFAGWVLLLASTIPFRLLATWAQGALAIVAGGVLKKKLLDAALRLDPQAVRGQGAGTFVGRVIETEAVESLALSGGVASLTALLELAAVGLILGLAAGPPLGVLLVLWLAVVAAIGARCLRRSASWTAERLQLTEDLVEKMVGHRTRLVQATPGAWHRGEDAAMERYLERSHRMDDAMTLLVAVAPRGWLLLALLVIGLSVVRTAPSSADLAISLGGMLLAHQALQRLATGVAEFGAAVISWRQVAPMLAALTRPEAPPSAISPTPREVPGDAPARLLGARQLVFTHPRRARPVIDSVDLDIHDGDRILLEGASGSGKSTLVSLLTGLRSPDAGVVLLRGLDRATLGDDVWRRHVATAPQFHENHVLTETFAFNLLLGRCWPPSAEDLHDAEVLCRDLGLAPLLQRMPAGMFEMVGESGWQLSHGEKSRLFMARALLQKGELVVLDESFTALDPATRQVALRCALARCKTLLVVAHP